MRAIKTQHQLAGVIFGPKCDSAPKRVDLGKRRSGDSPDSDLRFPQHVIDISSSSGGSGLPFSTAHRRGIILADFDLGKQNLNIIQ